jgi:hypothetical protein
MPFMKNRYLITKGLNYNIKTLLYHGTSETSGTLGTKKHRKMPQITLKRWFLACF